MKKSHFLLAGLAILIGLVALVAGTGMFARPYAYNGSLIEPAIPAADFTLTNQNGQPFRLSDQKGYLVVFFFGYTNCPDECPTTLVQFKRVRAQLGDKADRVRFVLVTVDPERDTPERLHAYLAGFDPAFIGLTGDPAVLETVQHHYGIYAQKQAGQTSGMDHTSRIYLVDARGNLRLVYSFEVDADRLAQDARHLADEI